MTLPRGFYASDVSFSGWLLPLSAKGRLVGTFAFLLVGFLRMFPLGMAFFSYPAGAVSLFPLRQKKWSSSHKNK